MQHRHSILVLSVPLALACAGAVLACPFCQSVSQTLTEEINSVQVVVVAQLLETPTLPKEPAGATDGALPKARFSVQDVLKGSEFVNKGDTIEVLYFGESNKDRTYLIMGTDPPQVVWSTPLGLSKRAYEYLMQLTKVPADPRRLEFFQEYLEDEDELLARDAFDEFAKAPYADVVALKDKMHHDLLIEWIKNPDVPASRRRLYFTMLGVCGQPEDAPLLQSMMRSNDRQTKAGLDALIACYLLLNPDPGLSEVEELFLKNKEAEYPDTYSAIMAIRFHGDQTDKIARDRLVKSLRNLLERPELADLVIPDLARWQDWEVMPRMVQLFKEADEKSSWVRLPVINYLRACPLPEAKERIKELSEIDPEAVKRAQTFFPFDGQGDGSTVPQPKPDQSSSPLQPAVNLVGVSADAAVVPESTSDDFSGPTTDTRLVAAASPKDPGALAPPVEVKSVRSAAQVSQSNGNSAAPRSSIATPNRWMLLGVPVVTALAMLFLLSLILGYPLLVRPRA
jgi:hypothetical protein